METKTKEPLYKVLNEQRTQADVKPVYSIAFIAPGQPFISITLRSDEAHGLQKIANIECEETPKEEAQANAEFTALAINNLNACGDALDLCIKLFKAIEEQMPDLPMLSHIGYQMTRDTAKDALKQIS